MGGCGLEDVCPYQRCVLVFTLSLCHFLRRYVVVSQEVFLLERTSSLCCFIQTAFTCFTTSLGKDLFGGWSALLKYCWC